MRKRGLSKLQKGINKRSELGLRNTTEVSFDMGKDLYNIVKTRKKSQFFVKVLK